MIFASSPSNMLVWYSYQLDLWQFSLKYSNLATELLNDMVSKLVKAWQTIHMVAVSSPSLSQCHLFSFFHVFVVQFTFLMALTRLSSVRSGVCLINK